MRSDPESLPPPHKESGILLFDVIDHVSSVPWNCCLVRKSIACESSLARRILRRVLLAERSPAAAVDTIHEPWRASVGLLGRRCHIDSAKAWRHRDTARVAQAHGTYARQRIFVGEAKPPRQRFSSAQSTSAAAAKTAQTGADSRPHDMH
jgi:hypothetical protein